MSLGRGKALEIVGIIVGHTRWNRGAQQTTPALAFAVFTVSLGYGVLLPLLPDLLATTLKTTDASLIAKHVGLVTGMFAGAPILFAPLWGRLSDRIGSKRVLLAGLVGFAATSITPPLETTVWTLHAGRIVNGAFAAAVVPASLAAIAAHTSAERRARGFGWIGVAAIAGYFVGPVIGSFALFAAPVDDPTRAIWPALTASTGLTALSAIAIQRTIHKLAGKASNREAEPATTDRSLIVLLLGLSATAAGASAAFEVGIVVHARAIGLGPQWLALLFAECSLVMLVAQVIVFSSFVPPQILRRLITPSFVVLALGLALTPASTGLPTSVLVTGAVAAAAGLALPALTFWTSFASNLGHGLEQGRRTAVISFGQAVGSVAAGFLSRPNFLPEAPFFAAAGVVAAAALAAALLSSRLAPLDRFARSSALERDGEPRQ